MRTIRGVGGLHLNISGMPVLDTSNLDQPEYVGSVPFKIPLIKPKLLVNVDDRVKIGTPLFHDKKKYCTELNEPIDWMLCLYLFNIETVAKCLNFYQSL